MGPNNAAQNKVKSASKLMFFNSAGLERRGQCGSIISFIEENKLLQRAALTGKWQY
jgi:hypothetical protein